MQLANSLRPFVIVASILVLIILAMMPAQITTLNVSGKTYRLEVARSEQARAKGLGGRALLAPDAGMLFDFTGSAVRCFWMKDMHFALDIIWLDVSKRVSHIEQSVQPETYPHTFCPSVSARYVIELNAGVAVRSGITDGRQLRF
jgi:uncharacterized membrane protein (UPF0127 family)